jgi:hypothetical protein
MLQMDEQPKPPFSSRYLWLLAFVCFVIGFIGVLAYSFSNSRTSPKEVLTQSPETPSISKLSLPSRSISGIITSTTGRVQKFSRGEDGFKDASPGAQILLGESVAVKPDSKSTLEIPGIFSASLGENSELNFVNLFPENTVLLQKTGKIFYSVESPHPVAIRVLHTLISASSSAFLVDTLDDVIAVTAQSGIVKIAFVDNNNDTHVWEMEDGNRADINDTTRKIRFIKPL